jgi:3-oxoacyl-[acyl-carrier-protein] synthase-1
VAQQPAAVTGLGASTSLGDARTAAAAARARLARPAPLDALAFVEEDGAVPVVGHPVPAVKGFQAEARLLSLALPALRSLLEAAALPAGEPVALLAALPDLAARAQASGSEPPPRLALLERLARHAGLAVAPDLGQAFAEGAAGFAQAVSAALELLAQGRVAACVVGGVDSHCDDQGIDALAAAGRLKTDDNPVGLQPGEAAAFLLLERSSDARRRKAPVLAQVSGAAQAREPRTGDRPPVGQGFQAALQGLARSSGALPGEGLFLVLDRNGEAWRAADWGNALVRLAKPLPAVASAPDWDPAVSFGDTGAASGALGALLAARALSRGYAPGRCAVVLSSTESGGRGAVRIDRAG